MCVCVWSTELHVGALRSQTIALLCRTHRAPAESAGCPSWHCANLVLGAGESPFPSLGFSWPGHWFPTFPPWKLFWYFSFYANLPLVKSPTQPASSCFFLGDVSPSSEVKQARVTATILMSYLEPIRSAVLNSGYTVSLAGPGETRAAGSVSMLRPCK